MKAVWRGTTKEKTIFIGTINQGARLESEEDYRTRELFIRHVLVDATGLTQQLTIVN